jgi:AcrR family transcriptional regulator
VVRARVSADSQRRTRRRTGRDGGKGKARDAGDEGDGRRARSARTRAAIVEAFLGLVREKAEVPTAVRIAKRAGCSTRSVFERFRDFKELAAAAFDHILQSGLSTPVGDTLTRDQKARVAFHVKVRATNCENWLPLWRVLMSAQIGAIEKLQVRVAIVREMSRERLKLMYEPELSTMSPWKRDATLMALEALTDYESWGRLREHYRLSFEQACEVWAAMTHQLLLPAPK